MQEQQTYSIYTPFFLAPMKMKFINLLKEMEFWQNLIFPFSHLQFLWDFT